MENITIEIISKLHGEELLKFEKENRIFFEANLPPRADEYYSLKKIEKILDEIVMEQEYNGRGYATKAVKLVIDKAFNEYKFHRIEAGTSPANIGSQIVLIKNGFEFIGRTRQVININGKWEDGIMFERVKG